MKSKEITPIFIIGAARNGTTNLCNLLSEYPSISGVTHICHYGTCESNILKNKLYWGNLSVYDNYLNFVSRIQYDDYFRITNGNAEYLFKDKKNDYYHFYFDLMDDFAQSNHNNYWITKLDPLFFVYQNHLTDFIQKLNERYGNNGYKIISIKRNLEKSLISYLSMEGKQAKKRKKFIYRLPSILLQTIRNQSLYKTASIFFPDMYKIDFEEYIQNSSNVINKIDFLRDVCNGDVTTSYEINTSFKDKKKYKLTLLEKLIIKLGNLLVNIGLDKVILKLYYKSKPVGNPMYSRILMNRYFKDELKEDLQNKEAYGLLKILKL